jgi:hypothetical protein
MTRGLASLACSALRSTSWLSVLAMIATGALFGVWLIEVALAEADIAAKPMISVCGEPARPGVPPCYPAAMPKSFSYDLPCGGMVTFTIIPGGGTGK